MTELDEAKELLALVATPSALVTGTFLAFASRAIKENQPKVDHVRMWFALLASLAAIGVAGALALLMVPVAVSAGLRFEGHLEPVLVVFWMISLSVIGTLAYSAWVAYRCARELRRPSR